MLTGVVFGVLVGLAPAVTSTASLAQSASSRDAISRVAPLLAPVSADERRRRSTGLLKSGRTVTYQDVLRDPNNVALNIAYARTQIAAADYLGASATLERVLILAPGNLSARIIYAVVLYRLDNLSGAERQLDLVLKFPLSPRVKRELQIYRDDIARRKQRTKGWLLLHGGYRFDTNRSAGPDSGAAETAAGIVRLGAAGEARSDSALVSIGKLYVEHDLKMARRHKLFTAVSWYRQDQLHLQRFSFQVVEAAFGGVVDFGVWSLKPELFLRYATLSHEKLFASVGGRLTGEYRIDPETVAWIWGSAEALHYNGIHESPSIRRRSGMLWKAGLKARHRYAPRRRITGALEFNRRAATASFFSFSSLQVSLDHEWRLGRGQYFLGHLSYQYRDYAGRNPADGAGGKRADHRMRARLLYGVPLLTLYQGLPGLFDRTALTASVEATLNRSNIRNYDTTNWTFSIGLTKRFDF